MTDTQNVQPESATASGGSTVKGALLGSFATGVMMLGAIVGAYFLFPSIFVRETTPATTSSEVQCAPIVPDSAEMGKTYTFLNIHTNTADGGALGLAITIELEPHADSSKGGGEADSVESVFIEREAIARAQLLRVLGMKTYAELLPVDNRSNLQDEIKGVLQEVYPEERIYRIHFPQFFVQPY